MISQEFLVISKLEAAQRQIDEAISLFFKRRDVVSIHTLAAAAYQVVTDVCKSRGIPRELEDSAILAEFGIKKEVISAVRRPQNFFKHADKEDDQAVRFNPMLSVVFMMATVQYLHQLKVPPSVEREVFHAWFFLRLPSHTPPEVEPIVGNVRLLVDPEDFEIFLSMIDARRVGNQPGTAA